MALFVAADLVGTLAALLAATVLCLGWNEGLARIHAHPVWFLGSLVLFPVALGVAGLYEPSHLQRLKKTALAALVAVVLGSLALGALACTRSGDETGRILTLVSASFVLLTAVVIRYVFRLVSAFGFMTHRCLIVGTGNDARQIIQLVRRHPHRGLHLIGLAQTGGDANRLSSPIDNLHVLGTDDHLEELVRRHRINQLILAASEVEAGVMQRLRALRYRGVALSDYVTLREELTGEISLHHITEEWLFAAAMNNSRFHIRRLKRLVDIVASLVGLVLTAPLFAITAALIKLESPGTVFYRQDRLGLHQVPFLMIKFRSMRADAETKSGAVWAQDNDPRITRVGKWIRKFRIDEIPQLINVLKGEMSLVGPRPERGVFVKQLAVRLPFYAERLLVQPGLTGWAQVKYPYTASIEETRHKLQYDLYYIKHLSFTLDMLILLKTVKIVLLGHERASDIAPAPATQIQRDLAPDATTLVK